MRQIYKFRRSIFVCLSLGHVEQKHAFQNVRLTALFAKRGLLSGLQFGCLCELTLSQTTSLRLFQIGKVCRRQFQI